MNSPSNPFQKQLAATNPLPPTPLLTEEDVRKALPNNLASVVTPQLVNKLNSIANDPIMAEHIRDNFISFTGILKEGKYKIDDYINAVAYASYKMMGYNNEESYFRTFPARHAALVAKGASKKDISSYVSAYHKGKLVNLIIEQSIIPTWILNQETYQQAINVQASLMITAASELVRQKAADSILTHLKKPDNHVFQINMDTKENAGMAEMKAMLTQLAQQQHDALESGKMKTIDVAASKINMEKDNAD